MTLYAAKSCVMVVPQIVLETRRRAEENLPSASVNISSIRVRVSAIEIDRRLSKATVSCPTMTLDKELWGPAHAYRRTYDA